jgi:D-3-phosphoglycerate dehydrogenase
MARPIIAVTDSPFVNLDAAKAALGRLKPDLRTAKSASTEDIIEVARDADAVLATDASLPAPLIRQFTRCKVIGRLGLDATNIDLPAALAMGITVTAVPDYCVREVSDHTMALLLALVRKIPLSNAYAQSGRWDAAALAPIPRLAGRVLGLFGFGAVARQVVPKAKAFGLRLAAYDPYVPQDVIRSAGVDGLSLNQLLAMSDFVSIHAPLAPPTRGLFGADTFRKMKKGAMLVNTAQGLLIDEAALVAALDSGQLAGAALDVLATEPPLQDSPLLARDNVILTPHTGFYSVEAVEELQNKCASDVVRVLSGEPPVYPVKMV